MPIEGTLRELAPRELLQVIEQSRKTGTLRIREQTHPHAAMLRFRGGALVGAELPAALPRLGQLLLRRRCLTAEQVEEALREQQSRRRRPFGAIVAERGWAAEEAVRGAIYFQLEETVLTLLPWSAGRFRFEETAAPSDGGIPVNLAPGELLGEAERRDAEWESLSGRVPHARVVPSLSVSDARLAAIELQPLEHELLRELDGERTVAQLARELGRGQLEVARLLAGLVAAGVVELREPPAAAEPRRARRMVVPEGMAEAERALAAGELVKAQRLLVDLVRRHPRSAEVHLLIGRTLSATGHDQRAFEAFARAAEQDPLSATAFYHLGFAAARSGDLEEAEQAWSTYLRLPDADDRRRRLVLRALQGAAELRRALREETE